MNQDHVHSVGSTSVEAEFARVQIEQAMETVRSAFALLVQTMTALMLANITIVGFALSTQRAGLLLFGFLFPATILYAMYRADRALVPIVYTAVNLEAKYGGKSTDWLASTFAVMLTSAEAIAALKEIGSEPDYEQRINQLRKVGASLLGSRKSLAQVMLAIVAIIELIAPIVLILVFQWSFF